MASIQEWERVPDEELDGKQMTTPEFIDFTQEVTGLSYTERTIRLYQSMGLLNGSKEPGRGNVVLFKADAAFDLYGIETLRRLGTPLQHINRDFVPAFGVRFREIYRQTRKCLPPIALLIHRFNLIFWEIIDREDLFLTAVNNAIADEKNTPGIGNYIAYQHERQRYDVAGLAEKFRKVEQDARKSRRVTKPKGKKSEV